MPRVHELATELEVPSSKVLEVLTALGVPAKAPLSSVSDVNAEKVRNALQSKTLRSSKIIGKRDFRVRDISTPTKSPSIRPRPTIQSSETSRRVVKRKVIKRVVRRASQQDESVVEEVVETTDKRPPKPEVPNIQQAVKDLETAATEKAATEKAAAEARTKPDTPAKESKPPDRPKTGDTGSSKSSNTGTTAERDSDKARRRRPRRGRGGRDRRSGPSTESTRRPEQKYAPVGKGSPSTPRNRPPRPKVPKIPKPEDYLRPRETNLKKSMEKLAADGLKSSITTRPAAKKGKDDGKRKRRRKIIKDNKRARPQPQGGRGRNIRKQVQSELDNSTTFRKRGRGRGRRDRDAELGSVNAPPKIIKLSEHVSIKELSAHTGLKSAEIITFLMKELEVFATINMTVDQEIAALICDHFGFKSEMLHAREVEDALKHEEDKPEELVSRPPVVTVLGHVDHGKTKLLDAIRGTDVVATEAGGITQKIGAFQVEVSTGENTTRAITFIDTPGHAAFTAMRARGAEITDIAVLVVAANDGVMPQTLEAIDHARSAGVEIIVAINKIDLPDANPEIVKQQLSERGLVPEEWGGQIIMVPISAKKKQNIDTLLEQIITVTDILELKANQDAMAEGSIIEARLDKGRGALATALVKRGMLDVGDYVVVGRSWGRIRQMTDEDGRPLEKAGPSTPILISGLNQVPAAGDKLNEVKDEKTAREIYEKREMDHRQGRLKMVNAISLEDFYAQLSKGETKELNIILKADLQGSIEALRGQLENLSTGEVAVKFIHTAVGNISDSDIMLAMASKAVILGFNVVASPEIRKQASMEGIDIMTYNIIYKAVENIQAALEGMLEPEYKEQIVGRAEVRQIFKRTNKMVVAGLFVEEGKLIRGSDIRILRKGEKIAEMRLGNLKRFKDDVKEVENGYECGVMLDNFNDLAEGDQIVSYETIKILRTLESRPSKDFDGRSKAATGAPRS